MAVDEALLLSAIADPSALPTLRFYRWREPTISLGYFQSAHEIPTELATLPFVRRLSGGGAIVHHHELTYSLVLPAGHWPRAALPDLVRDVHHAIQFAIPQLVAAEPIAQETEPFLCFQRRSARDLVAGSHKIVGSAQRSRRGALLQHGSILQQRSPAAPRFAGLHDLGTPAADGLLMTSIRDGLSRLWGWNFEAALLGDAERSTARGLDKRKYRSDDWNRRR